MAEELITEVEIEVDQKKIDELQSVLEKKQGELVKKVYAVSMTAKDLDVYDDIISSLEWRGKEALGILEIAKKIEESKNEGIKNGAIFMNALEIEATHYFLNKFTGKGKSLANDFIRIFKSFEQALTNISMDNKELDDLKKDLAAAQQGLKTE
jgi:hypothetical protein